MVENNEEGNIENVKGSDINIEGLIDLLVCSMIVQCSEIRSCGTEIIIDESKEKRFPWRNSLQLKEYLMRERMFPWRNGFKIMNRLVY
jgi:hypothetical protein